MNKAAMSILNRYSQKYSFIDMIKEELEVAVDLIIECYNNDGKILICGNGGSNSDADHFTGELVKGFLKKRPLNDQYIKRFGDYGEIGLDVARKMQMPLSAINLGSQTSLITAILNDIGGEYIFSQQVMGYGRKDDVFIGISTSGNSKNIINAAITAKVKEMKLIALTGDNRGKMNELFDVCLKAQSDFTPDIQDMHTSIYHVLCACIEAHYFLV